MRWRNYHGHCNFCDGRGTIEEFILKAIELNMAAIGISSHAPVPFKTAWTMPEDKLDDYIKEVKFLKEKYKDDIDVLLSLEVDYIPGVAGPGSNLIKSCGLDYVIGSIHFMGMLNDGVYWAIDGAYSELERGLNEVYGGDSKRVVTEYYRLQREMIQNSAPDIIGHMDKIKMHNKTNLFFDESANWYRDELRHTFEVIKEHGTIVEINTKSLFRSDALFPGKEYFKWLKEMDIPVTINSDAHQPDLLLVGFEEVSAMLKDAGIKYLHEFIGGKWKPMQITNYEL